MERSAFYESTDLRRDKSKTICIQSGKNEAGNNQQIRGSGGILRKKV
jgi:hypothetical protein